jgi:hypothetical protein
MKKYFVILFFAIFIIFYFFWTTNEDYYVKKYPEKGRSFEVLLKSPSAGKLLNNKVKLHIETDEISDLIKDSVIVIVKTIDGQGGVVYKGLFKSCLDIDVKNASSFLFYFVDYKKKLAYQWFPINDDTYSEVYKHKDVYIRLNKDGSFNLKYKKWLPYFLGRFYNR